MTIHEQNSLQVANVDNSRIVSEFRQQLQYR